MNFKGIAERSAIVSTFIKLPFVIKIFVLSMSGRFTQALLYPQTTPSNAYSGVSNGLEVLCFDLRPYIMYILSRFVCVGSEGSKETVWMHRLV